jgi:hypothetical protein
MPTTTTQGSTWVVGMGTEATADAGGKSELRA